MMVNAYSQKAKREKSESYFPGMTSTNMFSRMKTTILRKELADLNREMLSAKKACCPEDIRSIHAPGAAGPHVLTPQPPSF